ncbi:hypothetical protein [Paracoccus sp. (in: a-proteobacteria)]|uniref:hypothetical protein n=1 Tax=Paracoccus sp. TaxID=267 RepID=UPI003A89B193
MTHPYDWTLQRGPVGVWGTVEGSFSAVTTSTVTFRADGTGLLLQQGRLGGDHEMAFRWRLDGPGELAVLPLTDADPDRPEDWDRFRFRTGWRRHDVGEGPVLENDGAQGLFPADGFYGFLAPVRLISRPPEGA